MLGYEHELFNTEESVVFERKREIDNHTILPCSYLTRTYHTRLEVTCQKHVSLTLCVQAGSLRYEFIKYSEHVVCKLIVFTGR